MMDFDVRTAYKINLATMYVLTKFASTCMYKYCSLFGLSKVVKAVFTLFTLSRKKLFMFIEQMRTFIVVRLYPGVLYYLHLNFTIFILNIN